MRKALAAIGTVLVALLLVACTPEENAHLSGINDFRGANGLPALAWEEGAYGKAHDWAEHLAAVGRLEHSKLSDGVPAGWRLLGENVAVAASEPAAMQLLESSAPHRANLLNPWFNRVAVGVAWRDGRCYVTEVFLR
jgi:uncharacterized protein YkwD